jgi:hypothetical protein
VTDLGAHAGSALTVALRGVAAACLWAGLLALCAYLAARARGRGGAGPRVPPAALLGLAAVAVAVAVSSRALRPTLAGALPDPSELGLPGVLLLWLGLPVPAAAVVLGALGQSVLAVGLALLGAVWERPRAGLYAGGLAAAAPTLALGPVAGAAMIAPALLVVAWLALEDHRRDGRTLSALAAGAAWGLLVAFGADAPAWLLVLGLTLLLERGRRSSPADRGAERAAFWGPVLAGLALAALVAAAAIYPPVGGPLPVAGPSAAGLSAVLLAPGLRAPLVLGLAAFGLLCPGWRRNLLLATASALAPALVLLPVAQPVPAGRTALLAALTLPGLFLLAGAALERAPGAGPALRRAWPVIAGGLLLAAAIWPWVAVGLAPGAGR